MNKDGIRRPGIENPLEAPMDAVSLDVECMKTDFIGSGENRKIKEMKKEFGNIHASMSLGTVSISDHSSDVMLTVRIEDMAAIMAAVYEIARKENEEKCQTETLEPVGVVDGE